MSESQSAVVAGLTREGCRRRQQTLCRYLQQSGREAAFFSQPRHVHYFTGHWQGGRPLFEQGCLLTPEGESVLFVAEGHEPGPESAVDKVITFSANPGATLIDDQHAELIQRVLPQLKGKRPVGCDEASHPWHWKGTQLDDVNPVVRSMRRQKDPDEIALLQKALSGCVAAYAEARRILRPGMTEVALYAGMLAAAVKEVGEPLVEFGNDFQCGATGSLPREREVLAGETAILDVGVVLRGYSSDSCRTLVVGDRPTQAQRDAHGRVLEALDSIEKTVKPGVSCRQIYNEIHRMLDGWQGWSFPHHLGHGIGLAAHEAPRLNPHWDDTFQEGDVFAAEPGLYGETLNAGIRIEQIYQVTATGVHRLLDCSTAFVEPDSPRNIET